MLITSTLLELGTEKKRSPSPALTPTYCAIKEHKSSNFKFQIIYMDRYSCENC
jgi:hypothetical protein